MVAGSFCVGQRLLFQEQPHRVFRDIGDGLILIEELTTGRIKEHRVEDLLRSWKTGELTIGDRTWKSAADEAHRKAIDNAHEDAFKQSYSALQQQQARAKLAFVQRLASAPRSDAMMTPLIDEIWADKKLWKDSWAFAAAPHFTSVARWIRRYYAANCDIRSLVPRNEEKGASNGRLDAIVQQIIDDLITTRYLTEERPTIKSIHKDIKGMVALRNSTRLDSERLKAPSYKALKRKVSEIEPYACCRARYGQRVAAIKFRVAGAGVQTARPLARAAMDHSRMDIFVVDEVSRLPLGRPWLTIIIDEHTRYILGYYLSFEDPSNVSMTLALRHALAPKDPSPDVKSTWDAWGVMETLVVDNGMEFHSCALEAGAGRFGITVQFCPRRKPWFKGKVERFFGTLNTGLLVDMHGKTFSNLVLKGDYDPAKHAVMTLATLRRVLHIWVVDVYHQDDHSALGTTPHEAWLAGLPQVDRYLPPSSVAMDAAFSKSVKRTLTHKGIEFDTLLYNSTELGKLRELHGSEIEVEIRTYDDDIGSLVVVFPDGKTLLKVAAIDSEYAAGLTRWQHRVCKRFQRRTEEDDGRLISLLEARKRIRSLIEQDMQLTSRKTRKQQQRFLQKTTDATSPNTEPPPALASSLGNSEMPASETAVSATPTHSSPVDEPITDASQAPVAVSAPVASTPVTPLIDVPAPAPEACATDADADDVDDVPTFRSRKVTYGKNHER